MMSKRSKISRLSRLAMLMVITYAAIGMAWPRLLLATSSTGGGPTKVGGLISTDTMWSLVKSPYIVTKGILINHGVTLTIEAGVEIKINQGVGFRVDGTLIAKGTEDQRITFTANGDTLPGSWGFIHFTDPSEDAAFDENGNYAGGSILQYCSVRYGGGGEWTGGTIIVTSASPLIDHCKIEDSAWHGIRVTDANDMRISHNTIDNCRFGISLGGGSPSPPPSSAIITNNTITRNRDGGIWVGVRDQATIINNMISENKAAYTGSYCGGGGIKVFGGTANISGNIINGNYTPKDDIYWGGGIYVFGNQSLPSVVTITDNTISDNFGWPYGGGICVFPYSTATITNNIITDNYASQGGGIYLYGGKTVITANTITRNSANEGSGVYVYGGESTISDNIIAENTGPSSTTWPATPGVVIYGWVSWVTLERNLIARNYARVPTTDERKYVVGDSSLGETRAIYVHSPKDKSSTNCTVNYNSILDNDVKWWLYYEGGTASTLDATNNYWGTTDPDEISARICDFFVNSLTGIVNFQPFLTEPDVFLLFPTGLTAEAGSGRVTLTWFLNAEPELSHYIIYRSTVGGFVPQPSDSVGRVDKPDTAFTDTGLTNGTTYYYRITAVDSAGNKGGYSKEVSATPLESESTPTWSVGIHVQRSTGGSKITAGKIGIRAGDPADFATIVMDAEGNPLDESVIWRVEGEAGTVDENGHFVASTRAGDMGALIATAGGISDTVWVTIVPNLLKRIEITPVSVELNPGDRVTFKAQGYDGHKNPVNVRPFWHVTRDIGTISSVTGTFVAGDRPGSGDVVAFAQAVFGDAKTGVEGTAKVVVRAKKPDRFALSQNYPNPFNANTTIPYALPQNSVVRLLVYDVQGALVRVLVSGAVEAGYHQAIWDGRDAKGRAVSSGIYLVRLEVPKMFNPLGFSQTRRMVVIQ